MKASMRVWLLAARPKTLPAAIAPVMMGTALAYHDGGFHGLAAVAALAGALLIQIGTNYCNDYADFQKGADTDNRLGPVRATQAGLVSPRQMLMATVVVFVWAALVGSYMVYRGGWLMLVIAASSIGAGVWYTVGRYALAYLGLADVFVLIFFGPVAVGGTYYVQTLEWPLYVTVAGLAPGLLSCAILLVNNLRDIEEDRRAQKRTLVVRLGPAFARAAYLFCIIVAVCLIPMVLWLGFDQPAWLVVAIGAIGWAKKPVQTIYGESPGAALNPALGATGRLLFIFALLFTVLIALDTLTL